MKLITFTHNGTQKIGAVEGDVVYDFSESSLPKTMVGFIELGEEGIKFARDIIAVSYTHLTLPTILLV